MNPLVSFVGWCLGLRYSQHAGGPDDGAVNENRSPRAAVLKNCIVGLIYHDVLRASRWAETARCIAVTNWAKSSPMSLA